MDSAPAPELPPTQPTLADSSGSHFCYCAKYCSVMCYSSPPVFSLNMCSFLLLLNCPTFQSRKRSCSSGHGQSLSRVFSESAPTLPQYLTLALTWKSYPLLDKAYCSCNMLVQQRSSSLWRDLAVFKMKYFFPFIHMNSCTPLLTSPLAKAGEQTESFPGVAFNKNNKTDLKGSKPHRKTCPFQNLE